MLVIVVFALNARDEERKKWRSSAYKEGIGEDYDLELKRRLLELQRLQPQNARSGPNPYAEALDIVRLQKGVMTKKLLTGDTTIFNVSNSIITRLNLSTVFGDLTASVRNLQAHGDHQIAHAIKALTNAVANHGS